ncbi:putative late blight resistance protein homolog R1C-3 [Salvia miltiorrhiza]|uniref:putative late blight resistance protein homolog R1C-3 n=1 Tax=Salvia miltiorrhiza TaxID=226208 RepID=UPI0025AD8DE6|nr:putative late blight resistance protein homolog R1C-3 [Salvia miltiorrhiza]XP_057789231.1 putative late blight resistance protein homolog R1C-3 [Salvia miltiorrhiza]
MTAFGAVISLRNTIDFILHSSHFSLIEPSPHIIQLVYEELDPLQEILYTLDDTSKSKSRKKVNALDGRIKDLIWEFEDLLVYLLHQQIHSKFHAVQIDEEMKERVWEFQRSMGFQGLMESLPSQPKGSKNTPRFYIDLQFLQHDVSSFIERLEDLEEEYIYEVDNMPEDEDEDDDDQSISTRSGTKSKMIGLSDQFQQLKQILVDRKMESYDKKKCVVLVGTAGVGKTALAEAVFEDPEVMSRFEHRVWVRVGRKSQFDHVSRAILAEMFGIVQGDDELGAYLEERLEGKECLIVLDDVWEQEIVDSLKRSLSNGLVHILVTTRDRTITLLTSYPRSVILVRFLNEEESKELLCEKVFGEKDCPFQLDKAAGKIAKKCEGLPLMIVTVADILLESHDTDPKYWEDVAEMRNSVFTDAYNAISKVLFPSYDYLPQHLKMPFLYMGVLPPDYDIPKSKLMNMLATEGWFYKKNKMRSLEESFWLCLDQLCANRSLVLFNQRSAIYGALHCNFKTCRLLSSWRHLCRGEARKNKFYCILKKLVDGFEDDLEGQRCLCLENNLLFGIKEFSNSVRSNCASSTHSLLFFGPYLQYPIPIGDDFEFLGKLDALNLRLYTFPTEILTLVLLKYLALTCNGELPPTISKLFNLRVLIIHPHNNIRICRAPSYVPIEIWDMQELEHIEILGKSFVAPCHSASLEKLSTLVGVNASICTILELSRKVPCIKTLGVQIELTPYDDCSDLLSCFDCVSTIENLETLKCSIVNPLIKYDHAFPSSLKLLRWLGKLHLSGMGFSWEYMDVIGSLPYLEVLKLRAYAFRGPKWEAREESFLRLLFLLIEDSDLVQWKPRSVSFPELSHLSMKHCYKLEEFHWLSHHESGTIELLNCNPVALTCAMQLQPNPDTVVDVTATSSFDEKPVTIKFTRRGVKTEDI